MLVHAGRGCRCTYCIERVNLCTGTFTRRCYCRQKRACIHENAARSAWIAVIGAIMIVVRCFYKMYMSRLQETHDAMFFLSYKNDNDIMHVQNHTDHISHAQETIFKSGIWNSKTVIHTCSRGPTLFFHLFLGVSVQCTRDDNNNHRKIDMNARRETCSRDVPIELSAYSVQTNSLVCANKTKREKCLAGANKMHGWSMHKMT